MEVGYTTKDLENWNRKEHFHFFNAFQDPFFSLVSRLDVTESYHYCKEQGINFFVFYLYQTMRVCNTQEAMRLRVVGDEVRAYHRIDASATVGRADGTFGFSYMEYKEDWASFLRHCLEVLEDVRSRNGLNLPPVRPHVLHISAVPWVDFSALTHASPLNRLDSVPKISYGKVVPHGDRLEMAVSVTMHHGLADGYHAGMFYQEFQRYLSNPILILE